MIKCDDLIKLGYKFRTNDEVYGADNHGGEFVTLGKKVGKNKFENKENSNHVLKLENSNWLLIRFSQT